MHSTITILGLVILLWGCSAEKQKSPGTHQSEARAVELPEFPTVEAENVFVYECAMDSIRFSSLVKTDSVWLFLPDRAVKLAAVETASGAKYTSGRFVYWSKGEEALLQIPGEPLRNCHSIPQERSWQAAKIRGVDFRALGQEPGWYLEIYHNEQIKYVGNYGEDTIFAAAPDPIIHNTNKTEYRVKSGNRKLIIGIEDKPCTDSMSGFKFPATVSISVNGETYRGCGKTL